MERREKNKFFNLFPRSEPTFVLARRGFGFIACCLTVLASNRRLPEVGGSSGTTRLAVAR